jgi:hypothetical protein
LVLISSRTEKFCGESKEPIVTCAFTLAALTKRSANIKKIFFLIFIFLKIFVINNHYSFLGTYGTLETLKSFENKKAEICLSIEKIERMNDNENTDSRR